MAIKDVFAVNSIFLSISPMNLKQIIDREKNQQIEVVRQQCVQRESFLYIYLIPKFDIESKIDMKVLMMIVVENAIWLPWLPKGLFESDARMINDSMVICVDHHSRKWNYENKIQNTFIKMYSPELLTPMNCE